MAPTTALAYCCAAWPAGGGRGAAKTHLPTNEAALKQLAVKHELPGLVLEHRCVHAAANTLIQEAADASGSPP